jgi:type I restriction enzyme S subunit
MKEWKKVKIKDICNTNVDQYSQKENWTSILYLDTGNLTNNVISSLQNITIGKDELPSRARRKVKHLDILYSTVRPNQRHFGIIVNPPDNMLVSTGFCVIQCVEGKADPYFMYYYLSQNKIVNYLHVIGEQSVSAYPSIKPTSIENIELKVPGFQEQVRIGKVLSSLDDKIALNTRINDNLILN